MKSLNHIFRTIWSEALNTWVAVSENTPSKGKSRSCVLSAAELADNDSESGNIAKSNKKLRPTSIAIALACCYGFSAQANPIGAQVVNGTASINQSGNLLTITNSPNAIINWQGFSINTGETANFIQQSASSSILNRVIGSNPSALLGTMTSNGRVFLINPAGIMVGQGARIDVGGLVASTLNLSNADFLAGKLNFTSPLPLVGDGTSSVNNKGTITTPEGGTVYLVAPQVENYGVINTPKGETILAAGNTVRLFDTATPEVIVQVTGASNTATNLGQILADSGQIGVVGAVVKNTGTISASSMVSQGGKIFLRASNRVEAGGTITANGTSGGTIELLGNQVGVMDAATVTANGTQGGGTVLVGGDAHGANPNVQNAQVTYVAPTATISTNATDNGNGGKLIVWSDNTTRAFGNISAKGGANGGNGGFIETSGHYLDVAGIRIDATASNGNAGNWLLDPINVTIDSSADAGGTLAGTAPSIWTPSATGSTITNTTIQTALNAGTSVTITTTGALAEAGDINVNANIAKTASGAATLTLQAANNITLATGVGITSTSGALNVVLNADSDASGAGAILLNTGSSIVSNGGNITLGGGSGTISAGVGFAQGYGAFNSGSGVSVLGNLTAGGGNIVVNGIADAVTNGLGGSITGPAGIEVSGNGIVSTTGAGTITLIGQSMNAGAATQNTWGVDIGRWSNTGTAVTSVDGNILINGTSGSGYNSIGALAYYNSTVQATGLGNVTINGTAGNGVAAINSTNGVQVDFNSSVLTHSGILTLNGVNTSTTGSVGDVAAVEIQRASTVASTSGAIRIIGQAVNGVGTGIMVDFLTPASTIGNGTTCDILLRSLNGTGIGLTGAAINTTGNVTLDAVGGGAITQTSGSGSITAAGLRVLGDTSATASLTSTSNHVTTLAGNLTGTTASLNYTDSGSFGIGSLTTYDGSLTSTNNGLSVANGALTTAGGNIAIGSGSGLNLNGGTLTLSNLTNNGTLSGAGTLNIGASAGTLTNNGIIAPGYVNGSSVGTLAINGNVLMGTTGSLNVDMQAPLSGSYDVLNVSGTATLTNGTLNLSGVGAAYSYPVLTATGGIVGTFGTTNSGTFTLTNTSYNANNVTLAVGANTSAAIYWTGAATGDWGTGSNWSGGVAPTASTNVYVPNGITASVTSGQVGNTLISDGSLSITGGSLALSGASTVNVLNLSGGTLQGSGNVTLNGSGTWTGSTLTGSGTLTVASGATLGISGAGTKYFGTSTLANNGTVTWSAGQIVPTGNNTVTNNGLFDIQGDLLWGHTNTGNPGGSGYSCTTTFTNGTGGTLRKSNSTGVTTLGSYYGGWSDYGYFNLANNGGALDIQGGSINLNLGSSTLGASLIETGAGILNISGGSLSTGTNNLTAANLTLSNGSLTGTGNLSVTNDFNFTNGTLGGTFYDVSLSKAGAFTIGNVAALKATHNITLTAVGGDLTVTGSGISKTSGGDATATLNATGNVNINAGITASGTGTGKLDMAFNANTDAVGSEATTFSTTTLTANGGSISVPGAFAMSSGTATINSPLTFGGSGTWSGGTLTGAGTFTVNSGATLTLNGGFNYLGTLSLINNGTVNWSSGQIVPSGNNTVTNNGLFNIQGDAIWGHTNTGNPGGSGYSYTTTFTNSASGTLRKSAGAGVTTLGSYYGGWSDYGYFNLANNGSIQIQSGTANLNLSTIAGFTNSGTINASL